MIGVASKPGQAALVEEFFELFKTPWEFYVPGRTYDVVVVTTDEVTDVEAALVIVYGAEPKPFDIRHGICGYARKRNACLAWEATQVPLYAELLTFDRRGGVDACVRSSDGEIAGVRVEGAEGALIRLGYDVFDEMQRLFVAGQPVGHAHVPTLDLHIAMLRQWIVQAGLPLVEVSPTPAGHPFFACLTHDIDFVGIRRHRFDHTLGGFLYRSTIGAIRNVARGRLSLARLWKTWRAVVSLPFVYLGWAKDFWNPFEWYLQIERNLPATYYLIPFKRRAGDRVVGTHAARRGAPYDVTDAELGEWIPRLLEAGAEVGVHGIDAWHSASKGHAELARVAAATGASAIGVRMHWLLCDADTPSVLERAGYSYDSTSGYNETIGYRTGTTQVFRPLGVRTLLQLPMHIQDGALFYPQRLDLPEPEAETRCGALVDRAKTLGGVLTVLWHDRSHGPERFWGDFYVNLVDTLKASGAAFATAQQVVTWFRLRRQVRFETFEHAGRTQIRVRSEAAAVEPPLRVVLHNVNARKGEAEIAWDGGTPITVDTSRNRPRLAWARAL